MRESAAATSPRISPSLSVLVFLERLFPTRVTAEALLILTADLLSLMAGNEQLPPAVTLTVVDGYFVTLPIKTTFEFID